jgi:hypothetical protein
LSVDKLSARSVRQLAEIGAGFNLLKRQAFWILQTNVQDSQLYVQLPILCLVDPNVGLIQTRGSSFGFLSEQGVAVQSRAGQVSSGTRPMRYIVPYDGATGSIYHLVLYNERHRSSASGETAGPSQPGPQSTQAESEGYTDEQKKAASLLINHMLRPEVAAAISNIFLTASTEPEARKFVRREILNGPPYAIPPGTEIYPFNLGWDKPQIYQEAIAELMKWYDTNRGMDYEKREQPEFPLGINFNIVSPSRASLNLPR